MSTVLDLPPGVEYRIWGATALNWDLRRGDDAALSFLVPGSAALAFLEVVRGLEQDFPLPGGLGTITRRVPLQHPMLPGLYAAGCRMRPLSADITWQHLPIATDPPTPDNIGTLLPDYFEADVAFETPAWGLDDDFPMADWSQDGHTEGVTAPGYSYALGGAPLNVDQVVQVAVQDLSLTVFGVPDFNPTAYAHLWGRANATAFLGFPPGRVLMVGTTTSGSQSFGGLVQKNGTHRLRYREQDWRHVFHAGAWAAPTPPLYELAELNDIWTI